MKILLNSKTLLLLGCSSLFFVSQSSHSGQTIYQLTESNGTTLLTNKKSKYSTLKVEKKTYYPDSNMHNYSNWGASEAAVLPSYNKNKNGFDDLIRQAAQTHGISEGLIKAVMHTESGFNVNARSPVGAQGLMQLMPATARRFNVSNAYDPQQNIHAGAKYLAWLTKRFNGNTQFVLAGYNAGEGNVKKYGGIPPFRETQDYVRRVTSRYNNLYSNGLSSSLSNSSQGKFIAQSSNESSTYTPSNEISPINNTVLPTPVKYAKRDIVLAENGTYTDSPSRSYSTSNATASAKITISN